MTVFPLVSMAIQTIRFGDEGEAATRELLRRFEALAPAARLDAARDYLVIPIGTTFRVVPGGDEQRMLWLECPSELEPPKRYRNEYGQLIEGAPYSERDIRIPRTLLTIWFARPWPTCPAPIMPTRIGRPSCSRASSALSTIIMPYSRAIAHQATSFA